MEPTRRDFLKQIASAVAVASLPLPITPKGASAQDEEAPKSLLVIGWDGAGLNNVGPMLAEDKLPFLRHLINKGGSLAPLEPLGFTNTAASWSNAFTGLTFDQTSVMGNWRHDLTTHQIVHIHSEYPYFPKFISKTQTYPDLSAWIDILPFEHTIVKPMQDRTIRTGWFVSKRLLGDDVLSPFRNIALNVDNYFLHEPIRDTSLPASEQKPDDSYLGDLCHRALEFATLPEPFFAFLHLDPDYYGHRHGEQGERYLQEFIRCDKWLGTILQAIDRSKINIIVMADHGFNPGQKNHSFAPDAWMATDLPVDPVFYLQTGQKAFGTMRDVANTILDHFGILNEEMPLQMRGKSLLV